MSRINWVLLVLHALLLQKSLPLVLRKLKILKYTLSSSIPWERAGEGLSPEHRDVYWVVLI